MWSDCKSTHVTITDQQVATEQKEGVLYCGLSAPHFLIDTVCQTLFSLWED